MKVASNFLFSDALFNSYVGQMNTQVRLLNTLVSLADRMNSELVRVRCVTRNTIICELYAIFTVQCNTQNRNTFQNFLPAVYFLNTYRLLRALHCLHKLLLARIAKSFEITLLLLQSKPCHLHVLSSLTQ